MTSSSNSAQGIFFNSTSSKCHSYVSQDAQWTYDPWPEALARQQLVNPEPDFAFGLKVEDGSDKDELARQVSELTFPPVTPFCIPTDPLEIAFPFFIMESKSLQGDPMSCNNQMANGLIKALDVIASLGLQETLYVIGICQIGFTYEIYLAFSSCENVRPGVPRKVSREVPMICSLTLLVWYQAPVHWKSASSRRYDPTLELFGGSSCLWKAYILYSCLD